MPGTSVQAWKNVNPKRDDATTMERAIRVLDRQAQIQNQQVITDINTVITDITNITSGTTTVSAKWVAYTGPVWLIWFLWSVA